MTRRRRRQIAARNAWLSSAWAHSEVLAQDDLSSGRGREALPRFKPTHPYEPSLSSWAVHALLTEHLKRRGFSGASLIALRILSEGVESGLSTVLLAFHWAVRDARDEWELRTKKKPPVCESRRGIARKRP